MFSLGRWSSRIHAGFLVSDATQARTQGRSAFRLHDYHVLWSPFPGNIRLGLAFNPAHRCIGETERLTTPDEQRMQSYTRLVWALPVSLATTQGISVDFLSSGY